ncbi:MAG: MoaD/ThiS family protein [Cyanobacteria bacterium SBLK]|nr:MoaD/ThiS family protein [Cyanobacteria bacterium SBLK]
MIITVKFFAAYQEAYNCAEMRWEFPENTPVSAVLEKAIAQHPYLKQWQEVTRFGINFKFVEGDTLLKDGDEVVLIPPVSGGLSANGKQRLIENWPSH